MDLATFERLLTDEGRALVAEVHARAGVESDLALGTRLRREHDPALVAAAVTQNHLRSKAVAKFGPDAADLWFTHDALEQSTRHTVATARAERLLDHGVPGVLDLGCSIGGDLLALARVGLRVRGVEQDPVRAAIARANLAALGLDGEVSTADLAEVEARADEVVFLDPARRSGTGRVFDVEAMEPPWTLVTARLEERAVVKTMPGIEHRHLPDGVEAQWVSDGGDLVEACLWSPDLATTSRRATLLPGPLELTGDGSPAEVGPLGTWLHEPDDAVTRAGLVGALAQRLDARLLDPHLAYLTSDGPSTDGLARSFRVVEELPYREKQLRAALVARDVGTLTIKKRGVDVSPERLVRRLRLDGSRTAVVVLARVGSGARAFLVEPAGG
ncbi:class I SAM-dependent methyltransferase [Aeromicrobium halocynthiae]|uniref:Class I SAM-dependent methyltransferase n=1 Tax=Aeromicrobium halocynthiae TaxID=560557 RepID=A0ABN2VZJ0_9ACTN